MKRQRQAHRAASLGKVHVGATRTVRAGVDSVEVHNVGAALVQLLHVVVHVVALKRAVIVDLETAFFSHPFTILVCHNCEREAQTSAYNAHKYAGYSARTRH